MKLRLRFVLPLIAVALLALSDPAQVTSRFESDQRIARITWPTAIRLTGYLVPSDESTPQVRRSPSLADNSVRGAIWNADGVIWLSSGVVGTQAWLTIFHEQVHYLQIINGVDAGWGEGFLTCVMEREALDFTNTYAREIGAGYMQRTVETWRKLYKCKDKREETDDNSIMDRQRS